jgi:hypothetical protein
MRMIASWLGSHTGIHRIQGCSGLIATTWQARLRSPGTFLAWAHYRSARAFAVNPARLKARPCGLRRLTAQRGQATALSSQEWEGVRPPISSTNGGLTN